MANAYLLADFLGLGGLISGLFQKLFNLVGVVVGWVLSLIVSAIQWLWESFILPALELLLSWLVAILPSDLASWLAQKPWNGLRPYVDGLNWFIPIYAAMGIASTALGIAAAIRLARWVKSFIPTIGG